MYIQKGQTVKTIDGFTGIITKYPSNKTIYIQVDKNSNLHKVVTKEQIIEVLNDGVKAEIDLIPVCEIGMKEGINFPVFLNILPLHHDLKKGDRVLISYTEDTDKGFYFKEKHIDPKSGKELFKIFDKRPGYYRDVLSDCVVLHPRNKREIKFVGEETIKLEANTKYLQFKKGDTVKVKDGRMGMIVKYSSNKEIGIEIHGDTGPLEVEKFIKEDIIEIIKS